MKTLELNQMELVEGGSCGSATASGIVSLGSVAFSLLGGPIGFGIAVIGFGLALYNQAEACQ